MSSSEDPQDLNQTPDTGTKARLLAFASQRARPGREVTSSGVLPEFPTFAPAPGRNWEN